MTTAPEILKAGIGHMQDRATTYDKEEGERSMAATVAAFNAVTGDGQMNTEERGWLFMVLLKAVRCQQGRFKLDNYENGAAYFGLMGEAASKERKRPVARHPMTPNVISYPAVEAGVDVRFDQTGRQENVEQNGNDGAVYPELAELAIQEDGKPIGDCERCQGRVIPCDGYCEEVAP